MNGVATKAELAQALAGRTAAVLFHATWCPHCVRFVPVFRRAAGAQAAWRPVEAVLDDEDNPLWTEYAIEVVPTVILFEDGKVVKRLDGVPGQGLDERDLAGCL